MKSRRVTKGIRVPRDVDLVVTEQIDISIDGSIDRRRDFSAVEVQQGHVPLDPDSNEQGAINNRPQRFKKKLNKP